MVEVAFFLDEGRADGLENTSVVQLLAILVVRIRDDDRRAPDRHQFGDRSPPTATNHEVGSGKQAIHVRRNCTHIRHVVPRHVGVAMPHRRVVAEPGQVHDLHLALHSLQRRRHNFIKNASTLATTGDQNDRHICLQPQRTPGFAFVNVAKAAAQRRASELTADMTLASSWQANIHALGKRQQPTIGTTCHGVLFQ